MSCNLLFHEMSLKKHSAIAGCVVPFEEWPVKPGLHSEQLLIVKANYLLLFLFSGNTEHLAPNCSIFFAVYSWNFKYSSSVKNDCHSYHEKKKIIYLPKKSVLTHEEVTLLSFLDITLDHCWRYALVYWYRDCILHGYYKQPFEWSCKC